MGSVIGVAEQEALDALYKVGMGSLTSLVYGDVMGSAGAVVASVESSLGSVGAGAIGVGARAAEEEIRSAMRAHIEGLSALVSSGVNTGGVYLSGMWDMLVGLCKDFYGLVDGVYGSAETLGAEMGELTVLAATPAGVGATFAPSVVPMLTQLRGAVGGLLGQCKSASSLLGSIRFLAAQLGVINLEVFGAWLSLAEGLVSTVVAVVDALSKTVNAAV